MNPVNFPQVNSLLYGGSADRFNTGADVSDLQVSKVDNEIISCWKASWWERLSILIYGRVWLRVAASNTHSPVCIQGVNPWKGVK